jgi:hypothetical protein
VANIQSHYAKAKVNMHKLRELKKAFVNNFGSKTQIQSYYEKYVNKQGRIDREGVRKLAKDFGFHVNDE